MTTPSTAAETNRNSGRDRTFGRRFRSIPRKRQAVADALVGAFAVAVGGVFTCNVAKHGVTKDDHSIWMKNRM